MTEQNEKDRIEELTDKIERKYPELTESSIGIIAGGLSLPEQIKAYYELEMMEHTKKQDKIMIILTILNIIVVAILGYLAYIKP